MTIELDSSLAQAEILFLSFAQLAADIDRRSAEARSNTTNALRKRRTQLKDDSSTGIHQKDQVSEDASIVDSLKPSTMKLPELSPELRDLLKAGR